MSEDTSSLRPGRQGFAALPPEAEELWEINAKWWQDSFTEGADVEYREQIVPLVAANLNGATRVLDVGTGEGQLARLAASVAGVNMVTGIDPTPSQLRLAAERGTEFKDGAAPHLARAEAASLPFASESFDAALACLVFEHIEAVDTAIAEVSRVLITGGRFLFLLNHPLLQTPGSGWIDDHILEEQYWRIGPYLNEDHGVEEVDKNVWIPFIHRPLSRYVNALATAGLYVTHMEEPAPPPGFIAQSPEYSAASSIPRLLLLRAEKLGQR